MEFFTVSRTTFVRLKKKNHTRKVILNQNFRLCGVQKSFDSPEELVQQSCVAVLSLRPSEGLLSHVHHRPGASGAPPSLEGPYFPQICECFYANTTFKRLPAELSRL